MTRTIVLIGIGILLSIGSSLRAKEPAKPKLQQREVGRYQLVTGFGELVESKVYVIDTMTGHVWSKAGGKWRDEGNPTKLARTRGIGSEKQSPKIELKDAKPLTVVQRSSKDLPGSDGRISVHVDDITGGQVLLTIRGDDGRKVIDQQSVRVDDIIDFEADGRKYLLCVVRLANFLIGDDFVEFAVSVKPAPKPNKK